MGKHNTFTVLIFTMPYPTLKLKVLKLFCNIFVKKHELEEHLKSVKKIRNVTLSNKMRISG